MQKWFGTIFYVLVLVTILVQYSLGANYSLERWKRQACGPRRFRCDSGQCIDDFLICDGARDCNDGSDETSKTCQNIGCPQYAYRCAYGACVNADAKCNNRDDCADGSDEKGCGSPPPNVTCKKNQFQCKSGTCIDFFLLCDGPKDCDDGSDETDSECGSFSCPSFAFRCDYGACIDRTGVCNGVIQCADGSDEKPERCGVKPTSPPPTTPPPSNGCKLPSQPENGEYKLGGCAPPCQPVPGNTVQTAFLTYSCNTGFVLTGSQILLCEGRWLSAFPTCSRASCPALVNPSREIECKLNDRKVDCDKRMATGTKAVVKCNNFYTHAQEFSDFDTVCGSDGKWSREVTSCIPKCGEPNPKGVPFISGGEEAKYGEYPWHVGIYRFWNGMYQQACGGSIISEHTIVTAAHCFWNIKAGKQFDINDFKIAIGKFYREWDAPVKETYVQYPEIERVILHNRFRGEQRLWQNDIALIIVKVTIQMTIAVRPICVDYNKDHEKLFTPGKSGIVVGWGITETQKQSETLHKATLPYVSFEDCEKGVPAAFIEFLANDKFCAGYQNGTSVCPGDSGGGYATLFRDGKWYLMGLVSVGVPSTNADLCNIHQYTTFTKVSDYYPFVRDNKSK